MKFLRKGKKMLRAIVVLLLAGQAAVVALAANPTGSYSAGGVGDYTLTIKKEVPDPLPGESPYYTFVVKMQTGPSDFEEAKVVVGSNGLEDGVLKISPDCEITGIVEVDPQIEGFKTETVFTLDREERIAGRTVVYSGGYKGFPDELKVKLDRDDAGNALREGNELRKELKLMVSVYDYGYIYNGKDHLVTRTFVIDQNTLEKTIDVSKMLSEIPENIWEEDILCRVDILDTESAWIYSGNSRVGYADGNNVALLGNVKSTGKLSCDEIKIVKEKGEPGKEYLFRIFINDTPAAGYDKYKLGKKISPEDGGIVLTSSTTRMAAEEMADISGNQVKSAEPDAGAGMPDGDAAIEYSKTAADDIVGKDHTSDRDAAPEDSDVSGNDEEDGAGAERTAPEPGDDPAESSKVAGQSDHTEKAEEAGEIYESAAGDVSGSDPDSAEMGDPESNAAEEEAADNGYGAALAPRAVQYDGYEIKGGFTYTDSVTADGPRRTYTYVEDGTGTGGDFILKTDENGYGEVVISGGLGYSVDYIGNPYTGDYGQVFYTPHPAIVVLNAENGYYNYGRAIYRSSTSDFGWYPVNGDIDLTVTNTFKPDGTKPAHGKLTVEKTIAGSGADPGQEFDFRISLFKDGKAYTGADNNWAEHRVSFHNGVAQFKLKGGESVTAIKLEPGISYKVEELDSAGYTVTATGTTGTITAGGEAVAAFRNTKGKDPDPAPDPGKDPGPGKDPDPGKDPEPEVEPEPVPEPEYPTELPDPNDPDSPERITILEEGVPKTYVKVWEPVIEEWIYIPEEEVPLWGSVATGDGNVPGVWLIVAGMALAGVLFLRETERRNRNR